MHNDGNGSSENSLQSAIKAVDGLNLELRLHKATELARHGRYSEAEAELSALTKEDLDDARVLDLQARIKAQQGDLREANALWYQAMQLQPGNKRYREAFGRSQSDLAKPFHWRKAGRLLRNGFLVAVALGLLYLSGSFFYEARALILDLVERTEAIEQELLQQRGSIASSEKVLSEIIGFRNEALDIMASHEDLLEIHSNELADIGLIQGEILNSLETTPVDAPKIDVLGIRQVVENGSVLLTFEEGLFLYGSVLRPQARDRIRYLGEALEPYADDYMMAVIGYTDDVERKSYGEYPLTLLRAAKVIEVLSKSTLLSEEDFVIGIPGSRPAPYSNATTADRLRNRTVILLLYPRGTQGQ